MASHPSSAEKKPLKVEEAVHIEVAEDIPPELEVLLHTEPLKGLTDAEVHERTLKFGLNEIPEAKTNPFLKFLSYFLGPISYLLEIACILSAVFKDWIDFGILLAVLVINACIGFFEEARAESALDALKNTLALRSRCWRNSKLVEVDSNTLVPGDIIALRLGDIVPADCRLLGIGVTGEQTEGALQIDQSALTGESLPVQKGKGSTAYSSAIVKQGQMLAVVTKTGINTFIGRAANLISITTEEGHFQKIINSIGNFLVLITCVMAIALFFIRVWAVPHDKEASLGDRAQRALLEVLVLTIAAIPVGLPTIMSVTMAVGASQLAKKQVIVKRLTAIEELASVSILCSDKTGTLTLNQLTFDTPYLSNKGNTTTNFEGTGVPYTEQELLLISFFASEPGAQDAIESAVRGAAQTRVTVLKDRVEVDHNIPGYKVNNFIPFNPTSKYTEAVVTDLSTKKQFRCIKGAPQVIVKKVGGHDEATKAVNDFARRGLRALGVAVSVDDDMTKFEMVGMISLLDPPRPDSAHTIEECRKLGIQVKMITGDQQIIGKEVAHRLGMHRTILDATKLIDDTIDEEALIDRCEKCDGFAQVIPEHKYKISSCPHFVIFSTRLPGYFYENAPSWIFIVAVAGTQVFAMFMSIFGIRFFEATAIGWGWGVGVLAISTLMFMLLDIVKVQIIRRWNFELTVKMVPTVTRKAKLADRIAKRIVKERALGNIAKVRKVLYMTMGLVAWERALKKVSDAKAGSSSATVTVA
ncbi:hypothetical protein BC830DRAFT_1231865 [Chytriomyces sp. MP71]|nr:hypothetical protein BC830DRAFT_1231865 [Chytriomyces sp. MP71]